MLRCSTQLVKSHRDDLGLEYLWSGDEYGSLENSNLALVHVIERSVTVHYKDLDKGTVFGEFLLIAPAWTFFIIQKNVTTKEN